MAQDLFLSLGAAVAGGLAAVVADRELADKAKTVGPVTLTPGAMGVGAGIVGLMVFGHKLPASARYLIGAALGGATVVEGVDLAKDHVLPLVERMFPSLGGGASATSDIKGEDYVAGLGDNGQPQNFLTTGLPDPTSDDASCDFELASSLRSLRGMCTF